MIFNVFFVQVSPVLGAFDAFCDLHYSLVLRHTGLQALTVLVPLITYGWIWFDGEMLTLWNSIYISLMVFNDDLLCFP